MKQQIEYRGQGMIKRVKRITGWLRRKKIFMVTGNVSFITSGAEESLDRLLRRHDVTRFCDFSVNPKMDDVVKGMMEFSKHDYDYILAVGGGSVIDMAKLISVLIMQDGNPVWYVTGEKSIKRKGVPLIAVPTTAGSGSEATHFAVCYHEGQKYSVAHPEHVLPDYVILDPDLLKSLPTSVKVSAGLDVLCHAIESYWSVNATDESKQYSEEAISLLSLNLIDYSLYDDTNTAEGMLYAANFAGKAINITKTTGPHALSYGLTHHLGVSHGRAAAYTLGKFAVYNYGVTDADCNHPDGAQVVKETIRDICDMFSCADPYELNKRLNNLMDHLGVPQEIDTAGYNLDDILSMVNTDRLNNNPRKINQETMRYMLT